MPEIVVIAEPNIGKLIQKYLERESVSVLLCDDPSRLPAVAAPAPEDAGTGQTSAGRSSGSSGKASGSSGMLKSGATESCLAIIDQSHLGDQMIPVMTALSARAGRLSFIILCSMEQTVYCEELERAFSGASITRLFKPIKLSELSDLVRIDQLQHGA